MSDLPSDIAGVDREICDLERRICELRRHRKRLSAGPPPPKKAKFDFSKYSVRHVLLHVAYLGWNYQGFVTQETTDATVEKVLFDALLKTRLIADRESSNYHRCGRTDKGVSAYAQAISIDLRSRIDADEELDYPRVLNGVLPADIRILGWASVPSDMSARFDCQKRGYLYYFPAANLNLAAMREAGQALIGEHDFRNLCKMDVANGVVTFVRRIDRVDFESDRVDTCTLRIEGSGFLWHQIRCVVTLLYFVGRGLESPAIVADLLDVSKVPCKPNYPMASELPLVLASFHYPDIAWRFCDTNLRSGLDRLASVRLELETKVQVIAGLQATIKTLMSSPQQASPHCPMDLLIFNNRLFSGKHVSLLHRERGRSLENRICHFVSKGRISPSLCL